MSSLISKIPLCARRQVKNRLAASFDVRKVAVLVQLFSGKSRAKMLPLALPFVNTHVLKFFAELALSNVRLFRFAHNNRERSSE
jgi:hypothetical protein